jgi:hypothetical protein
LVEGLLCVEECEMKVIIHFGFAYLPGNHPGILFCTKSNFNRVLCKSHRNGGGGSGGRNQEFPRDPSIPQVPSTL